MAVRCYHRRRRRRLLAASPSRMLVWLAWLLATCGFGILLGGVASMQQVSGAGHGERLRGSRQPAWPVSRGERRVQGGYRNWRRGGKLRNLPRLPQNATAVASPASCFWHPRPMLPCLHLRIAHPLPTTWHRPAEARPSIC